MAAGSTLDHLLEQLFSQRIGYSPARLPQSVYDLLRTAAAARKKNDLDLVHGMLAGNEPELVGSLIDDVTVSHTAIFRHPGQFDHLRQVLPSLHRQARRPLMVWSAGCATGEEPYSIAVCAEQVGVPLSILATDVSPGSIAEARRGSYQRSHLRGRQWSDASERWNASESHKRMITFEVGSLVGPDPTRGRGPFDIIFCRNVLIYFERRSIPKILQELASHLFPSGSIVVSPADTVLPIPDMLHPDSAVGWLRLDDEVPPSSLPTRRIEILPPPRRTDASPIEQAAQLLGAGEVDAAERNLTKLINEDPNRMDYWFLLGETLLQRGERLQARLAFQRAAECTGVGAEGLDAETLSWAAARRAEALSGS
jgi:chemotaxis protein methyltransferase CheR